MEASEGKGPSDPLWGRWGPLPDESNERVARLGRANLLRVLDDMIDGAYISGGDGLIEYANPALRREFGPHRGKRCFEYFYDRTEPCARCRNGDILAGRTLRREWHSPRNGRTYCLVASPLKDPDGTTFKLETLHDITESKRGERQLRQSEERLRTVVANAPVVLFAMDSGGEILVYEGKALNSIGQQAGESVGQNAFEVFRDQPRMLENLRRALEGKSFTELIDAPRRRIFETSYSPMRDEEGRVSGIIGVSTDVTEHIQFLQAQKMEAVGQLAGGVAHDFNNLMTVVTGYAQRLLRDAEPQGALGSGLEEIHKAGQRAIALTRQLLAFSRKQIMSPEILDLNSVVADTARMLRRVLGEDIDLEVVLPPDLGRIRADRMQVEQVLMNLAVNARDAMLDGGALTIETADVVMDEASAPPYPDAGPGPFVMLAISDTGCGMDEETRSRIFEPFFTTKAMGTGTGLGLSTVYGIIRQSGGDIRVYTEVGQGSTFRVYLPRATPDGKAAPAGRERPAGRAAGGAEAILLVEDDALVRELLALELRDLGYSVLQAGNIGEALMTSQRHEGTIHLLLSDVVLPGLSGRRLFDVLSNRRPDIKILYMSGHTERHIVHHGVIEPGTPFISKPFTSESLARKLREVLDS